MPMIHTHSFLALGLISAGAMVSGLFRAEDGEERRAVLRHFVTYGAIAVILALPQLLKWSFPQTMKGGSLGWRFNWANTRGGHMIDEYFWFWIKNVGPVYIIMVPAALCAGRRMLVLDEPVTGLDPDAARELYGALAALRREGLAVLSVTHDLPAGVADATHVLEIGPCGFFGTKAEWDAHCRERPGGVRHAVGSSLEDPHLLCAGDCLK